MIIGLLGGSFNPVHIGHAILASYISQTEMVDTVWVLVSPHNPLKKSQNDIGFKHRFNMCKIAFEHCKKIVVSDFENSLTSPFFTINTLRALTDNYPDDTFKLIIGSDNLQIFHNWRDYDKILTDFELIVYPRIGYDTSNPHLSDYNDRIHIVKTPIMEISSTTIRNGIAAGNDMHFYMPHGVNNYIKEHQLYSYDQFNK